MTDQKTDQKTEDRQPKSINPVAIIAGALASLSAAVIASFFGVAGTLIGAAVASVVSSLAAVLYSGLLTASRGLVQRAARPRDLPEGPRDGHEGRTRAPLELAERLRAIAGRLRTVPLSRWLVIGGAAVVIFALAIGTLTAVEAAIREPIASALGVRSKGEARTSVGVAVRRASGGQGSGGQQPAQSTTTPPGAPSTATAPQPGQAPSSSTGPAPSSTGPASPTTGNQAPSTSTPSASTVRPQAPTTRASAPAG